MALDYQKPGDGFQVTVFDSYANVGKDVGKVITDVQEKICDLMKDNPIITIPELASAVNTTTRTIERNIAALKEKGMVMRLGGRKDGKWIVLDE